MSSSPGKAWRIFTSPGFVVALVVLVLNDHVLKAAYPNWLTGKLSDFSGLFAYALFWMAVFPSHRRWVAIATAVAFTWWKSPYSQGVIDAFNRVGLFAIDRVVDYTDLIALTTLPLAASYARSCPSLSPRGRVQVTMAILALGCFTATSMVPVKNTETTSTSFQAVPVSGGHLDPSTQEDAVVALSSVAIKHAPLGESRGLYRRYSHSATVMRINADESRLWLDVEVEAEGTWAAQKVNEIRQQLAQALGDRFRLSVVRAVGREKVFEKKITVQLPMSRFLLFVLCY